MQCGRCCSGPGEGVIWVSKKELNLIAVLLKMPLIECRHRFTRRVGLRTTVIEDPTNRDCIFLAKSPGQTQCRIYPVRPSQCRSWPFWPSNLSSGDSWNRAVQKCPGINRGKHHSFEEIERIRKLKKWWQTTNPRTESSKR
jgi:Fe-S-cluster containining protein